MPCVPVDAVYNEPSLARTIMQANSARKETSSTTGMQETVDTSALVQVHHPA